MVFRLICLFQWITSRSTLPKTFLVLESVLRKYAIDLARLIDDIDAGAFVGYSLEGTTQSMRV